MFASALAWAQDSGDKTATSGATSTSSAKENADDRPRNAFGEEFRGHVSVTGDVQFQNQYDDNVFAGTAVKEGGNLGMFSGRLSLNAQTPHSQWQMFYAPTVRIPETGPDNSGGSHQFGLGLQSRLTAATTLSITGNVNLISSHNVPQQQYLLVAGQALPVFYPGVITPGTRDLNPSGQISLSHQFSASDSIDIGVNGTANLLDPERNAPTPQFLSDSYSAGGYLGYRRNLTPATSIGVTIEHRYLADSLLPHLSNDIASLTFGHRFGPRWQFSASVGPSFLIRQGEQTTSYSASASLTRSTATLTYGLSYSDGLQSSAVSNATTFRGVSASINRTFARRWNAGASFGYSQNSSEFVTGDASSYSGSSSLRFAVTDQLSLTGSYSRLSQLSNGAFSPTLSFDRNVYSFGISYNLKEIFRY
jgi:hypothetical protein